MQITINTGESGPDEYTALIALLASLGGRLPTAPDNVVVTVDAAAARTKFNAPFEPADKPTDKSFDAVKDAVYGEDEPNDQAVDSKGTPWDARIHSESKATVADGSWRKRRGVSDELFAEVMAELTNDAPPPPPADEDSDVPLAPADEQVPAPPAPTEETPSEPAPAASAPVAGDPPTPAGGGQFADFAAFVAAVSKHGKSYAELNEMAGVVGVAAFKDLKDHADKWDMFFSMIG